MKSNIRKYKLFLIAIGTLLLSILLHFIWNQNSNTKAYASKIEKFIHKQEVDFLKIENNKVIQQLIYAPDSLPNIEDWDQNIKSLQDKPYSIFIHKKDSLIFWSNVLTPLDRLNFQDLNRKVLRLETANYWTRQIELKEAVKVTALIPINFQFDQEGDYLKNTSPALQESNIEFSFDRGLTTTLFYFERIKSLENLSIAQINAQKKINDWQQLLISLMCIISFLLIAFQIHKLASRMRQSHGNLFATTFLLVSVFSIRYLTILFDSNELLKGFDIFNKNINSPLFSSSLGDLLLNILIVTWLALFVHTSIQKFDFSGIKLIQRYLLSALNYFSIALGLLTVAGLIKSLVINSGIVFDFENVFNLDRFSFISLLGIIFLILSFFILAHGVVLTIIKLRLPTNIRIFTMFMAIVFSIPFFFFFELDIPFLPYYSGMIIFILLMDLMADNRKPNVTWFFAWMITLSALMAALLFKYNSDFDIAERLKFAKEIELERDEVAISSIAEIQSSIDNLKSTSELLSTLYPFQFSKQAVDSFKNALLYQQDYLNKNFDLEIYIYDQFGNGYQEDQTKYLVTFGNFEETYLKDSTHQIYHKKSEEGKELYYVKTNFDVVKNPDAPFQLIFEFTSKAKVFSDINYGISNSFLSDKWNRNNKDFALYVGGKRIQSNNPVYPQYYPFKKLPRQGTSKSFVYGERSELVYLSNTNLAILAGRNLAGLLKPISLFSYIFTLLCLSVFGLAIINTYFPFLPPLLRLTVNRGPSLRYRIQFVMIMLTIVSFIFIGLVTVYYFNNTSKQNAINDLQEKTNTLIAAFENEIKEDKTAQAVNDNLTFNTTPIAQYQKSAFQLFNADGQLISSSDPELYEDEIIGKKINYLPFLAMRDFGRNLFIQENKWYNNFKLQQAFAPVKWQGKNVAYLSVLQVDDQRVKDSGVNEFMGTLLNVYVFLFLIAGAIAIAIANSITRPLSVLGDKLKQLKLDKTNEPLKWDAQDELGELINDYNMMIEKLEESAQLLAITERDTAWREMARQVAHEIKNPLTPMQLSIQHLQNTMRRNPDADIKPMVDRVAKTLLEQIKNLSLIAGEFSNFAKMPQARNEKVILNEIVSSAHDLFRKRDDMDINLYIPIDEIYVFADHNQLVRVLNNLVKNAIQAIPTERRGRVDILLYKEEGKAIIKISDNGSGIAEDMKEKVFRPNFTTKTSGTGLGLAICSSIIESFNGKIYFETKENIGTQFYVEIPLMRLEDNFREEERVSL